MMLAGLAIPLGLSLYGSLRLSEEEAPSPVMDIALVQPSIAQIKKWDEGYFQEVMEKTWKTMDAADLEGADLIVLPETAVPDFLRLRPEVEAEFKRRTARLGIPILLGSLDLLRSDMEHRPYFFYNSAYLFSPDTSKNPRQYSKIRLVPFSERLPFEDILPLISYVNLGEGDFNPGLDYALWRSNPKGLQGLNGPNLSPSICYEIIYPDYVRGARNRGADILINITNDSWFGTTNAPYMHTNIARFRAVETGAPIARAANSGVSVFYDYKGRNLGETLLFEQTVLRLKLPVRSERTLYLVTGGAQEWIYGSIFMMGVVFAFIQGRRRRRWTK